MTPLQSVERELLVHAGALRALARDLVGEPAADDLVQATAVQALRSPPNEPHALFGWLATILRNLASKHRRGERRRQARERLAARDEALPSANAQLERREMLRRVTDAVLALPEPYQATLIRRYFEELTPTAIGLGDGVPLATVKSRLQRGLSLLRAELDRESSDWRRALLGLTGAAPVLLFGTGTLLMTTTTKLLCAAGALLAAALWFAFAGNTASPPPNPAGATDPLAAASAAAAVLPRDAAAARQEVPSVSPTPAHLSHPFAFTLQCTVVDRFGLPVATAVVFVAPRASALDTWPASTDGDGKATLSWRGKQPAMTMAIGVRREQLDQELQEVTVRSGAPQQLVLLAEPQGLGKIHPEAVLKTDGTLELVVGKTTDCARAKPKADCRACHEGPQLRSVFDGRCVVAPHLHPEARFADLLLPSPPPPGPGSGFDEWDSVVGLGAAGPRNPTHLAGVVYGTDGKPADDVLVVWSGRDGTVLGMRTSHGGQFFWHGLPAGSYSIHAGGGDEGLATATMDLAAGDDVRRDLFLDLGAVIRGRAIGADGAPLAQWRVEYVGGSWSDGCTTRDDGSFVLPNLPAGPARLLLWPRSGALPVAIEPTVLPDSEVVFDLRQRGEPKGRLRLFAALPDGVDRSAAEARVWQQDSGRGAAMAQAKDGAFVLDGLAAGFYRVEIGAESCGWRDLGPQWVDGKGLADLGRVELPRPGRVKLVRGADLVGLPEFYLRRSDCDVLAEDVQAASGDDVVMPVGDWLCLWRTKEGALRSHTFPVRAGEVVEVRVGGE